MARLSALGDAFYPWRNGGSGDYYYSVILVTVYFLTRGLPSLPIDCIAVTQTAAGAHASFSYRG